MPDISQTVGVSFVRGRDQSTTHRRLNILTLDKKGLVRPHLSF